MEACHGAMIEGDVRGRAARYRLVEVHDSAVVIVRVGTRAAALEVGVHPVGIPLERLVEIGDGGVCLADPTVRAATLVVDEGEVRRPLDALVDDPRLA